MGATRTPTETLMTAMQSFSEAEPNECLIIWTDEKEDLCWSSSTDCNSLKLGMIEFLRTVLKKRIEDSVD